jgi:hypothetical protein
VIPARSLVSFFERANPFDTEKGVHGSWDVILEPMVFAGWRTRN